MDGPVGICRNGERIMITVISYVLLNYFVGHEWSGWFMVLPIFTDLALIDLIQRFIK